ncbi:MAG: Spy/CpxP family protein refolding chaperone [Phycisphaerae bacterium]|jgi:Spy/CpxP family protein refolding chaperone
MKLRWIAMLAAALMVVPALAQVGDAPAGPPDNAAGRPPGFRPRGGQRGMGRFGGRPMERMAGWLTRELELDEEQQAELDEIVAGFRERLQQMSGPSEEDRELWEQMREARESGDRERMDQLREQMRQRRGEPMREMMDSFFNEVQTILDDEQQGRLATMRERMARMRPGGRENQADPRRMMESLPEQLGLTEEQQAQYDELLDEWRANARERRGQRGEEMRAMWEEMRAAQEAGDEARVEELRRQMRESRGGMGNPMAGFFDQLAEILTEEQQAKLAEIREGFRPGQGQAQTREQAPDLRSIMRAIRRLKLDRQQRTDVQKIIEEAMRTSRELNRRDTAAQEELASKTKQEIVKLLDADQAKEFEKALASEQPRSTGRQNGQRPGRGERTGRGQRPRGERNDRNEP